MTDARTERKIIALVCLVLVLGTLALYWPIRHFPFTLYDDEQYITGNRHVATGLSWQNFKWAFVTGEAANWHPLTWLSHQADCAMFGLNAGRIHLMNVLWHTADSLLVFAFLRVATGALWRSALVAALFAWHPLHVESVAWASERKDVLSTFFFLLTLIAYVKYARALKTRFSLAVVFYGLALFLFVCGLMSKPMVVTLPFVLLLLDWWPLSRISDFGFRISDLSRLLMEKIPFFILAIAGSAVTYLVQSGAGAVWATPWSERLANAAIAYASYVLKIFRPTDLCLVYSHPKHWPFLNAAGAVLLLLVWTIPILLNSRRSPYLAVGWFWFLGTLVPTIGIVQVGAQYMADRYSYIPSIGFFIMVIWGGWEIVSIWPQWKNLSFILAGVAVAGCCVLTPIQLSYWRDNVTLFRHAMDVSPDNYIGANCLGKAYEKIGDNTHAIVLYQASVEAEPRFPQSQFNYAIMLLLFGDKPKAFEHLEAAADLEPHNPDIQFDLGQYFAQEGNWPDAMKCFSNSVSLRPDYPDAQFNFAAALMHLGDTTNAAVHYREALRLRPDFTEASNRLERIRVLQKGP